MTPTSGSPLPSRRTFLSAAVAATGVAAAGTVVGAAPAAAAGVAGDFPAGPPPTAQAPDAELRPILAAIDPARIEATIRAWWPSGPGTPSRPRTTRSAGSGGSGLDLRPVPQIAARRAGG